jgi:conjugal transfer/entry exclusion protein
MAEINKLDAAFARFERALGLFEAATSTHIEERNRLRSLAGGAESTRRDQAKLEAQLSEVRQKAAELVDTSKQAAGKIDTAMGRIRSVLHSNSGA